ncbi:hypothetical protein ACRRTK_001806 [Alexandromys fortis]
MRVGYRGAMIISHSTEFGGGGSQRDLEYTALMLLAIFSELLRARVSCCQRRFVW